MRRALLAILGMAACSGSDIRIEGSDDGPYEGARVWAQVADLDANEALETQRSRVDDGSFFFEFLGTGDTDAVLAVIVQVEQLEGSGCGPSLTQELDGLQVGAVQVHTLDFTESACLGRPDPEPTTTAD